MGRREQNKVDAYKAIHHAAYTLVVQDATPSTVEDIAARACVSPRTFFNYYRSKEEAVMGVRQPAISQEQHQYLQGATLETLFDHAVTLYFDVVHDSVIEPERFNERCAPFRDRPEHKIFMHRHMAACEALVNDALEEFLDSRQMTLADLQTAKASARAVTILAGSAVRYTYSTHPDAFAGAGGLRTRDAIEVFKRIMKETL